MSAWWAIGQIVVNLISWGLIANFHVQQQTTMLVVVVVVVILYVIRKIIKVGDIFIYYGRINVTYVFTRFAFQIFESPRYYLARGDSIKTMKHWKKSLKLMGKLVL